MLAGYNFYYPKTYSIVLLISKNYFLCLLLTMKNIMRNAWAVIIVLYNCESLANICVPGEPNSILINKDKQVPIIFVNILR